ncbi:carbonic anhydrase [Bordetella parapertussis]|uniref:Carbonic anhydrase n=6 Tax=Bordetella TaxID=517 RepID=K0MAU1_BORPB|nr:MULTISPECIES: carbonic anhydrase [Bordetella]KAK60841.1 carbonate dehydratase [Bordetella bronchiseptica 980-2]SHQ21489.1 sulfate permease [Mycobacteroides abscessus subsp. abscessus]AMG86976.1 carbonate dehydratase [Bordetella bronchiseptica]AOB37761.1 carbonate dehydratase [Bordetella parapertussis]AUL41723.1 carbonate dehydratase [Bordetella parapertussis]
MFPKRLTDGYHAFLQGRFHSERSRYEALAEKGQKPEILLIGCCDSRVSPEVIFDAGPGEIFVVRNVANLVPPCEPDAESSFHGTSAAIEFAVNGLNVKHIVVLGHASCGGIRSFYDDGEPLSKMDFIGKWMSQISPVADRLGPSTGDRATDIKRLELAVVEESLRNLMTFPSISSRVERGELELHGTYFGVATGLLYVLDRATGQFAPWLEEDAAA